MAYTSTRPSLPGTPELPGEANAKAKLASIVAAYSLQCWAHHRDTDLNCWDDLRSSMDATSSAILELLSDYNVAEGDCCMDAVDDCIWQFLRDTPLSCEVRSSWYTAGDDQPDYPSEFRIWLTFGGPSCWIHGELHDDGSGIDDETLQVKFSWASNSHTLPINNDELAAIAWFCESLVC